jgi:hypothetical protein
MSKSTRQNVHFAHRTAHFQTLHLQYKFNDQQF